MNAREQDHVRVRALGLARELQRVTDEVGQVLDLALLIEMGKQHRVALALQLADALLEIERRAHGSRLALGGRGKRGQSSHDALLHSHPSSFRNAAIGPSTVLAANTARRRSVSLRRGSRLAAFGLSALSACAPAL